ncbi:MAG: SDR family oxidoreductase [Bacteroidota bacterium]
MKNLLVTGASGFLGWNICHYPQQDWQIIGTYYKNKVVYPHVKIHQLNITDKENLDRFFSNNKIDGVLHAAALSQPNACANNPELSFTINVEATTHLAQICHDLKIPFLFTSSSQVFDGDHAPYSETDKPTPIHIYAEHKLLAEKQVLEVNPNAIVVRMPLMFGATSSASENFLKGWLTKMRNGEQLNVFTDEYRVPASGQSAADGLFLLLNKNVNGLFHLAGKDRVSRADMADLIQKVFKIPNANIRKCLQSDVVMAAKRPKDLSLVCDKMVELGYELRGMVEELRKLAGEL